MATIYRATDVPVAARLDYFQRLLRNRLMPIELSSSVGDEFDAEVVTGNLGSLGVTRSTTVGGVCTRSKRLIRQSNPDLYSVRAITRGDYIVDHAGTRSRLGPGDFCILDGARPFRTSHTATKELITVTFPRALLPLRADDAAKVIGTRIPRDHHTGALAFALLHRLPQQLDDSNPVTATGTRIGRIVIDLLAVALSDRIGTANGASMDAQQRTLLPRIYAFIEEHLSDPDLSPDTIAAAHHISVRYLHKVFQTQETTCAAWIRQRRLERCRADLLDPTLAWRPAVATAARWGFSDPAHFNRAFRTVYGLPPGTYRSAYTLSRTSATWTGADSHGE
jgi:AraC-like DNA-binding protein